MAEEDQDQKTEAPTGKRLGEARSRGQLAVSREVSAWVLFIAILVVIAWLAPAMAAKLLATLRIFLEMPHALSIEDRGLQTLIYNTLVEVAMATIAIFAVLAVAAIAGTMVQTGLFASFDLIQPDFMRLSMIKGLKKIFSTAALFELVKSFGKLVVLGSIVFFTLYPVALQLPSVLGHSFPDGIMYLHQQIVHLIIMLLVVFTAIAIGDYFIKIIVT